LMSNAAEVGDDETKEKFSLNIVRVWNEAQGVV
jgi:hypothetical protein